MVLGSRFGVGPRQGLDYSPSGFQRLIEPLQIPMPILWEFEKEFSYMASMGDSPCWIRKPFNRGVPDVARNEMSLCSGHRRLLEQPFWPRKIRYRLISGGRLNTIRFNSRYLSWPDPIHHSHSHSTVLWMVMNRWLHLVAPSCEAKWSAMPEGTNHTPAQNKPTDAKARMLIPDLTAALSRIASILFLSIFQAQQVILKFLDKSRSGGQASVTRVIKSCGIHRVSDPLNA